MHNLLHLHQMNPTNGVPRCGRTGKPSRPFPNESAATTATMRPLFLPARSTTVADPTHKSASAFSLWAKEQRHKQRLHPLPPTTDTPMEQQRRQRRPPVRRLKTLWSKLSNKVKNGWRRRARQLQAVRLANPRAQPEPQASVQCADGGVLRSDQIVLSECTPSNAAAHLLLLGESLQTMGESLIRHEVCGGGFER